MSALFTQVHFQRLEALRRVRHVLQGEPGSILLLKRDETTNGLVELLSIDRAWMYGDRDADGDRLPSGVQFELQVAEDLIAREDYDQAIAIQHGQQRFSILNPQVPTEEFRPTGPRRFWRFWIRPLEEVQ